MTPSAAVRNPIPNVKAELRKTSLTIYYIEDYSNNMEQDAYSAFISVLVRDRSQKPK
jgi:hypothetical protein